MAQSSDLTPVIVGIGEIKQNTKDLEAVLEPIALMEVALRRAQDDAGVALLANLDSIDVIAEYSWPYRDAPDLLCERLNISPGRRVYETVGGESPVRCIHDAALRIRKGESRVSAIVGAEAEYAVTTARKIGATLPWSPRDNETRLSAFRLPDTARPATGHFYAGNRLSAL